MATKWQTELKAKLKANPLYQSIVPAGSLDFRTTITCQECGGKGKRVPFYAVTNYGRTFATCSVCKKVWR
jgi:hypothetical protein